MILNFPVIKNKKHEKIMNILARVAVDLNPVGSAKIASCLVIKNQIVSFGYNQKKTHPLQAKFGKNSECIYLHSEIDSIKNALRFVSVDDLKKATLYICRVKHNVENHKILQYGLSKPCSGCANAIDTFGIKKVVFSTDNGYIEV